MAAWCYSMLGLESFLFFLSIFLDLIFLLFLFLFFLDNEEACDHGHMM